MANCDVPDLDLLPPRYGIKRIRFSAGMENPIIHWGMWLIAWGVRLGLPVDPARHASSLLKVSRWFDFIGSADGGMHIIVRGKDRSGDPITIKWFIIALDGDGPYIPCAPAGYSDPENDSRSNDRSGRHALRRDGNLARLSR